MRIEHGGNHWNIYFINSSGQEELFKHPLEVQDCSIHQVWPGGIMREITLEMLQSIFTDDARAEQLANGMFSKMRIS